MSIVSGTVSGILGSNAAGEQADASRYAAEVQANMYLLNRMDMYPQMMMDRERAGVSLDQFNRAVELINQGPGEYNMSPEAQQLNDWRQQNMARAVTRGFGAAAPGGGMLKELQNQANNIANQSYLSDRNQWLNEYQQRVGNLLSTSGGLGNTGAQLASIGQNAASNIGGYLQDAGAASASGYLNTAGVLNQASQTGQQVGMYLLNRYLGNSGAAAAATKKLPYIRGNSIIA